jgi:hypothetical protein
MTLTYFNAPKNKLSAEDRALRNKARLSIVQAANRHAVTATPLRRAPYTLRTIQRAVCVARHARLIDDHTLALAGFNPGKAAA